MVQYQYFFIGLRRRMTVLGDFELVSFKKGQGFRRVCDC